MNFGGLNYLHLLWLIPVLVLFYLYAFRANDRAIAALERAVGLNPQYSNARYFLGLSYFQVGRIEESAEQFTVVSDLNPDNEEVKAILENVKAGNDPFDNIEPPAPPPAQRDTLPIEGE